MEIKKIGAFGAPCLDRNQILYRIIEQFSTFKYLIVQTSSQDLQWRVNPPMCRLGIGDI